MIMRHSSQNKLKGHPKTIRHIYALIVIRKDIPKSSVGQREVDKKLKDPNSVENKSPKRKRGRKRHMQPKKAKALTARIMMAPLQILKQFLFRKLAQGLLIFLIQELVPI
jgi:hypothetical protein